MGFLCVLLGISKEGYRKEGCVLGKIVNSARVKIVDFLRAGYWQDTRRPKSVIEGGRKYKRILELNDMLIVLELTIPKVVIGDIKRSHLVRLMITVREALLDHQLVRDSRLSAICSANMAAC